MTAPTPPRADVTEAELAEIEARARACAPSMIGSVVDTLRLVAAVRAERARTKSIAEAVAAYRLAEAALEKAKDAYAHASEGGDEGEAERLFVASQALWEKADETEATLINAALAAFPEAGDGR